MLVGVAPHTSSIPTLWNIGTLLHRQAKLSKDMQHSVPISKTYCSKTKLRSDSDLRYLFFFVECQQKIKLGNDWFS